MSQKECPTCHYKFLKKKDFMDHVTYSSCAEKLQDILVLCPHCNKQLSDDDSLSYHLMRSEACSNQQDKAFDVLNRLPRSNATGGNKTKQHKDASRASKLTQQENNEFNLNPNVQQGTVVNCNEILDNQQDCRGGIRKKRKIFVPLEQLLHGEDNAGTRPYFPVDAVHHTQAWRLMSSWEQSAYVERNKHLLLSRITFGADEKQISHSNKGLTQQALSKSNTAENKVACGEKKGTEMEDDVQEESGVDQDELL